MSTGHDARTTPAMPAWLGNQTDGADGPAGRFNPPDPVRFLMQYRWLLSVTAIVGLALGVGLTVFLARVAPQYTAVATVEVKAPAQTPYSPVVHELGDRYMLSPTLIQETQAKLITSEQVLREALEDIGVKNTTWMAQFQTQGSDAGQGDTRVFDKNAAFVELKKILAVRPIPNTSLIEISVTTAAPTDARDIANTIVSKFIAQAKLANELTNNELETLFTDRRDKTVKEVENLRIRLADKMNETEYSLVESKWNEKEAVFRKIVDELHQTQIDLANAKNRMDTLRSARAEGTWEYTAEDLSNIDQDLALQGIDNTILGLKAEYIASLERLGPEHYTVKRIESRIAALELEREREWKRLLKLIQDEKLSKAEIEVADLSSTMRDLTTRLEVVREERLKLNQQIAEYQDLEDSLERRLEDLDRLENILAQAGITSRRPDAVRVQKQQAATIPSERAFPRFELMVPATTLLLLGLVTGGLFLYETVDTRIKSPSSCRMLPHCDLLGTIPMASEDPTRHGGFELINARDPGGLLAESFRQTRNEIIDRMNRGGMKSLLLVGCQPETGTSALAANLAVSFAFHRRRILLIDANFRRPAQHRIFDAKDQPGLSDILAETAQLDECIQPTKLQHLDLMAVGSMPDRAFEMLESPVFGEMIEKLKTEYDLVLIDTAPMSIVGDGRLLANRVDAFALVVRAIQEKRGLVSRIMRQLNEADANFLGMILNGVRSATGGYYRKNYQAYYEYQTGSTGSTKRPEMRV